MREIRTSGSMSGDGKRGDAEWPQLPRPSSTLPKLPSGSVRAMVAIEAKTDIGWTAPKGPV
jgi:hypothetical protein